MRRSFFTIGVVVVLALICVNGYFAAENLRSIRNNLALKQGTARIQADISEILLNLTNLQAAQRGYLLTEDSSYLTDYTRADEQLPQQLSRLRLKIADRAADERALEAKLEAVTQSIIAEADETIHLRQQGYRSRAFRMVKSNRGKELMDQARLHSASLLAAETSRSSEYDQKANASLNHAFRATIVWNSVLLVLTALIFGLLWVFCRRLEDDLARGSRALQEKNAQLETFTQTVSQDLPELLGELKASLENFLDQFEDYLPARGQEHAVRIRDMAAQSNRLMTNCVRGYAGSDAA